MSIFTRLAKPKSRILRQQDPHIKREVAKYGNPLPSREYILTILSQSGVPLSTRELSKLFLIHENEEVYFETRLKAMQRDGQILINRKGEICVASKLNLVKCRIQGHQDGYGFAIPEDKTVGDIFLTEQAMRQVFHGDEAMIQITRFDHRQRPQGRIVEVLKHAVNQLVGHVHSQHGILIVVPEDKHIKQDILIDREKSLHAKQGQVVVVEILCQPNINSQPIGQIIEVLGEYAESGMEIEIALRKHVLPYLFSDEAIQESTKISAQVMQSDKNHRVDLRQLPFLTIDGEDARDFDDAVYAEQSGSNWRLMVAIADVSYYVQPNSELDKVAYERGTSIYFPRRVIPMLPEVLSNGICSLNPQVERLCLVCDMQVTRGGKISAYQFYEAVITSQARLTYNQVWQWIQSDQTHPHQTQIDGLYAVFKKLLSERHRRGAIEFDSTETRMHFDENGKIDYIEPVVRNEAHQLIEECMLAANTCAANFITEHKAACLYRVHEGPTAEKLEVLRKMLAFFGLDLPGGDKPEPKHYAVLSEKIRLRADAPMLEIALLRSMQQAIYSPENKGHFGLAYANYVHFTSPIRRYPDLLTHRVIKAILRYQLDGKNDWEKMGEHTSFTERRADQATRDVEAWLKTYFMQDKIGEIFSGKISAVTSFGVFILLDNIYVEGLVHISALGKDYFHYRPEMLAIEGERTRKVYRLGDAVTVQVTAANLENRQIDFALVDNQQSISSEKKKNSKRKK